MPRSSIVAFDCETTGVDDDDYITCIASIEITQDYNRHVRTWHSGFGTQISTVVVGEFITYLWDLYTNKNFDIITFNGTSFDFKFLAKCVVDNVFILSKIEQMALISEDIMLDFSTEHGYFAGMESFATGCKLTGKSNTGAWAADRWIHGSAEEQQAVIDYCVDDVRVLCDLIDYRQDKGKLYRTSKAGKRTLWVPQSPTFRQSHVCIEEFEKHPIIPTWMKGNTKPDITGMWGWI